jgi:hypothetical protein
MILEIFAQIDMPLDSRLAAIYVHEGFSTFEIIRRRLMTDFGWDNITAENAINIAESSGLISGGLRNQYAISSEFLSKVQKRKNLRLGARLELKSSKKKSKTHNPVLLALNYFSTKFAQQFGRRYSMSYTANYAYMRKVLMGRSLSQVYGLIDTFMLGAGPFTVEKFLRTNLKQRRK